MGFTFSTEQRKKSLLNAVKLTHKRENHSDNELEEKPVTSCREAWSSEDSNIFCRTLVNICGVKNLPLRAESGSALQNLNNLF